MNSTLRFVQVFTLGAWTGSIFYFSAAVAPGAFRELANADQAGSVVSFTLGRLHLIGIIAAVLYLLAAMGVAQSLKALARPEIAGVVLMLVLTLFSQQVVTRKMRALRRQMGSVAATPLSDPSRREFDWLHDVSVDLEGGVMLIGVGALFLTVRRQANGK